MKLDEQDAAYLLASMRVGEVVLILGAGASVTSRNSQNEPLKNSLQLARVIAERAGLQYENEKLTDVLGAVRGNILSDSQLKTILSREFKGVTPSRELQSLFSYTWRRVYTWNIDDALTNLSGQYSVQRRRIYNGLVDRVAELEGPQQLHVVFLHGEVVKPDHGFILTENEYATWLKSEKHYWYQRAAQDYLAFCPVFIGSTLDEPILSAELERARRDANSISGRAFLFTPDELSPIRRSSLKSRGIVHIQGTLEDFVRWLSENLPGGHQPKNVIAKTNSYSDALLDTLTRDDLEAARSLRIINASKVTSYVASVSESDKSHWARQFLRGFPPNWNIAASDIPVRLEASVSLFESFEKAISENQRLFIVTGQSGSGKTTAIMMTLLDYVHRHPDVALYDLNSDVKSLQRAYNVLRKVSTGKTIIYVGDLFLFGDLFRDDLEVLAGQDVIVVSTARTGEWQDRLARRMPETKPIVFQRFVAKDYDPLIDRLIKYVPAPSFRKLSRSAQHKKLKNSRSQLLIALREATESAIFTDVITNEFEKLPDVDTKQLFLIVGISTIARVGISVETARDAYLQVAKSRTFDDALIALEGIVGRADNRRMFARHELYVRHILENVVTFQDFCLVVKSILRTYLKYDIPIVRSVSRLEALLFRFLFNHDFISDHARRHGCLEQGRSIYADFEVDFQLDGHFWLQYGLYLADLDTLEALNEAVQMLRRSVQAYPENPYALHALADVQLRYAKQRPNYDAGTRELISDAVRSLKFQDAQQRIDADVYPAVTLATGHVGALIKHRDFSGAKAVASQYFERLQALEKLTTAPSVQTAKEKMMRFVTLGEWSDKPLQWTKSSHAKRFRSA